MASACLQDVIAIALKTMLAYVVLQRKIYELLKARSKIQAPPREATS